MDRGFNLFAAVALTLSVILIGSSCAVASEDTSISVDKHSISVVPGGSWKTSRITELLKVRNSGNEEFEGVLRLPIPRVSNDVHGDVLRDNVTCLAVNRENDRVVVKPFTSSGVTHSQERADVPLSYRGQRENMTLVVRVDNSSKKVHPEIVSGKMAKPDWKTKRVNGVRFKYPKPIRAKFLTKSVAETPTYLYARENAFLVNLDNDKKQVRIRIENSHSEGWGLRIGGLENKTLNYELDGHENRRVKLLGWSPNFEAVLRLTYSIKQAPSGSTSFGKKINYPTSQLQFWILKIENRPIVKTDLKHFERKRKSEKAVWQVYQVENPTPDSKYNFNLVSKTVDRSAVSGWVLIVISGVVSLSMYGVYKVIGTNRANNFDERDRETKEPEVSGNVEMMAEALANLRKDYENGNIPEDVFKELEEKYKETAGGLAGERE